MVGSVVGLDIGGSGVRAAEFEVGRRATLRRFAEVALPEGVVRAGLVVDPEALTAALKELWREGKFETKDVVVGLANSGVLVRQMDLDWMPPADFRKALRYQVADALPVPVDEANLDYVMVDENRTSEDSEARRVARVLLVAAGREMVDSFVRAIAAASLRPVRVDLVPFALVRASSPVLGADAPLEAVVDIGADTVVVVVHRGGRPRFVRTLIGHGGDPLTQALMERYDWTWDEAERSKIVLGLPGHERPALSPPAGDAVLNGHPAQTFMAEQVSALAAELRATLEYFQDSAADEGMPSRVLLTGRAAALGGLAAALETTLGLPVAPLTVRDRVKVPRRAALSGASEALLNVPAGLCLAVAS